MFKTFFLKFLGKGKGKDGKGAKGKGKGKGPAMIETRPTDWNKLQKSEESGELEQVPSPPTVEKPKNMAPMCSAEAFLTPPPGLPVDHPALRPKIEFVPPPSVRDGRRNSKDGDVVPPPPPPPLASFASDTPRNDAWSTSPDSVAAPRIQRTGSSPAPWGSPTSAPPETVAGVVEDMAKRIDFLAQKSSTPGGLNYPNPLSPPSAVAGQHVEASFPPIDLEATSPCEAVNISFRASQDLADA